MGDMPNPPNIKDRAEGTLEESLQNKSAKTHSPTESQLFFKVYISGYVSLDIRRNNYKPDQAV